MEKNQRGNTITRSFHPYRERYHYDLKRCPSSKGWWQFDTDQDAPYFGVWVNPKRREILTFAEGDETLVTCPTEESFTAEVAGLVEFYGPPPAVRTAS